MGDPSVMTALISALDDREYSVRESAKWAMYWQLAIESSSAEFENGAVNTN